MNRDPNQQCEISPSYRDESVESSMNNERGNDYSSISWVRFVLNILIFRTSQILITGFSLFGAGITQLSVLTLNGNVNMENN